MSGSERGKFVYGKLTARLRLNFGSAAASQPYHGFVGIRFIRGQKSISAIPDPIPGFRLSPRLGVTAGVFSVTARSRMKLGR